MSKSLVFISWSGDRAKVVAKALSEWLGAVLQSVEAWCSESTEAGKFWGPEIIERLNRAKVGIVVVTPENRERPWLLFEAGAIAKALPSQPDDARAIPYLFDLETRDISPPLSLLQAMKADKEGTFGLVRSVNRTLPEPLADKALTTIYDALYPTLESALIEARALIVDEKAAKKRSSDDVLAEVLEGVRALSADAYRSREETIQRRLMDRVTQLRRGPDGRISAVLGSGFRSEPSREAIKVELYIWQEGKPKPAPSELFDEVEVPDSGWLPALGDTIHICDRKGDGGVYALRIVHRDFLFGWSGGFDKPIPLTQWAIYGRPVET